MNEVYESEEWGDGMLIARATCDCCGYYDPTIVAMTGSRPRFCGRCWYTCSPEECKYMGDDVTPEDLSRRLGTLTSPRPASGTPQP